MELKIGDKIEYFESNLKLKVKVLGIAKFERSVIYTFRVIQVIQGENRVGHIFEASKVNGRQSCWSVNADS